MSDFILALRKKVEPKRCLRGAVWKRLLFARGSHFSLKKVKKIEPQRHYNGASTFCLGKMAPLRKKRSQNSATRGSVLRTKTVPLRSRFGSSFFSERGTCTDIFRERNRT